MSCREVTMGLLWIAQLIPQELFDEIILIYAKDCPWRLPLGSFETIFRQNSLK